MDIDRWQRIRAALVAAAELDRVGQEALVERVGGSDDEFKRELRSLLEHMGTGPDLLEPGARLSEIDLVAELNSDHLIGSLAGPWKIVSRIDRGGMGAVYLGERQSGDFTQSAAIKFIARGMDSEGVIARFREERRILAALEHPNIVAIIDGGITGNGQLWFAMPYLEGAKPIDAFADGRKMPLRDRLELFRPVCSAVHFAHQNLVIHRDLKPTNILVTHTGMPMLMDFGIAKLIHQVTPGATAVSTRIHTPHFASPEQRRGVPVTTASDVYQLGLLLYRLLCGTVPVADDAQPDWRPAKPSDSIAPGAELLRVSSIEALRKQLRGDLDTICMRALDPDPTRRYTSAQSLSEDIGLYLRGLPVLARDDSLSYRAGKFLRRNRWGSAFAAAVLAAIVGIGAISTISAARLSAQSEALRAERDRAQAAAFFLARVFEGSNPAKNKLEATAGELLERAIVELSEDTELQDYERAGVLTMIGEAYLSRGEVDRAHSALLDAVESGRRSKIKGQPFANSLLILAKVEQTQKNFAGAEGLAREALAELDRTEDLNPRFRGTALNMIAVALAETGRIEESTAYLEEAIAVRKMLPDAETDQNLAANLSNLGRNMVELGRLNEAEDALAQAMAILERKFGSEHPYTAYVRRNRSELYLAKGDLERARKDIVDAIEIARKTLGEGHPFIGQMQARLAALEEQSEKE